MKSLRDSWKPRGEHYACEVPMGWAQGRSAFGGLSVAMGAALGARLCSRRLRTVQAQLLGPVAPGQVEGRARVLREGKTTTFVDVELWQEEKIRAQLSLVFVAGREDSITIAGPPAPTWSPPEKHIRLPYIEGVTPEFTKNAEFRFAEGSFPFQGADEASFGGYIRFEDDAGASPAELQLMLLDAWPCPTLSMLTGPAFASTVTWTAHLLADSAPGFHRFTYETVAARAGFSTALGHMWDSEGRHVGVTEQTVVVFD